MSTHSYPAMISMDDAIKWAERQPESTIRDAALSRLRYELDKTRPVKPKFHKGQYGKQYDNYTCGQCGHLIAIINNFCPNCGYAIGWDTVRCLTE